MKTLQALVLGAALAATANAQQSTYTGSDGLNDLAKKVGKYMGTATNAYYTSSINNDAAYMTELKNSKDWGMMTPESSMKMAALQPSRGNFNWGVSDQLVAMAKAQGMRMRCHVLLWYGSTPGWMNTGNNATMIKDMDDHITKVISHFGDDCYAWDVVNEIAGGSGGYSDNIWYKTIGPSFVAHAFRTADQVRKQLGLKVKLYYNEHSLEWGGAKTNWAVQLVKDLKSQGVPIDGMGFQGHFGVGGVPPQSTFAGVMKQFTDLGVEVALTEFDIRTDANPTDAKKQQQKKDYAAAVGACAVTPKCVGVTVWNFDDKYSWVPEYLNANEGYALPFLHQGDKLVRKIAYDGIVDGWSVGTPTSGPTSGPTTAPATTNPATPPASTVAPPNVGVPLYGQCGGLNYSGSTLCKEGTCKKLNDWYSQCV